MSAPQPRRRPRGRRATRRLPQQFVITFPGPLPREAPEVEAKELELFLRFAVETMRQTGGLNQTQNLFFAKLDELRVEAA